MAFNLTSLTQKLMDKVILPAAEKTDAAIAYGVPLIQMKTAKVLREAAVWARDRTEAAARNAEQGNGEKKNLAEVQSQRPSTIDAIRATKPTEGSRLKVEPNNFKNYIRKVNGEPKVTEESPTNNRLISQRLNLNSASTKGNSAIVEPMQRPEQSEIARLTRERDDAQERAAVAGRKLAESELRKTTRLQMKADDLQKIWKARYPRFSFDRKALKWAAARDKEGLLALENELAALYACRDPASRNRSKMSTMGGDMHSRLVLPGGVECRVFYRPIGSGDVVITQIGKKSEIEHWS